MECYFSGYYEQDALKQGFDMGEQATTIWLEPENFIKRCQQTDDTDSDQRWIWVYRTPWSLLIENHDLSAVPLSEICRNWASWQRKLLALRQNPKHHLVLINRHTSSPQDLIQSLGLALPPDLASEPVEMKMPGLNLTMGKFFEWAEPSLWDIVEALESCALMPHDEPLFRHTLRPPTMETVEELFELMQPGLRLPTTVQQLTSEKENLQHTLEETWTQIQQLKQTLQEKEQTCALLRTAEKELLAQQKESKKKATDSIKELHEENELLLMQLHQTQEELENYHMANQQMRTLLKQSQQTMDRARISLTQMALSK